MPIRRDHRRFFKNSEELLMLSLLEDKGFDAAELKRLRAMIERSGGQ